MFKYNSFTDSCQCIWAHIHGLCSYDHEALAVQQFYNTARRFPFLHIYMEWNYLQDTIIDLSSPIGASLYNIGTTIRSQRTTSSSSKCREKIRRQRLSINNGYEEKQQQEIRLQFDRN